MSYQPHLSRNNDELYHARTKGSKNGVSNTPGYRAIGKKATGRFVGYDSRGNAVYDYGNRNASKTVYSSNSGSTIRSGSSGGGARRKSSNLLERASSSVGNWLSDRGKQASSLISRAGRTANRLVNRARTAIGNAWDGKAGAGTGLDLRNERLTKSVGARTKSGAAALRKGADDAKKAYDRSIVGRFNAARDWLGKRAGDVSDAANRVGKAASGAARRAGRAAGKLWDGKAGAGTGLDLRNERLTKSVTTKDKAQSAGYREAADVAKRDYDRSIVGRFNNAKNAVSNWAGDRAKDVSNAASKVGTAASNTKAGQAIQGFKNASEVKSNYKSAQKQRDKYLAKIDSASTPKDRAKAQEDYNVFMRNDFAYAEAAYNQLKNINGGTTRKSKSGRGGKTNRRYD